MTIVPGMWYKLLHGNPEFKQLIKVDEVRNTWFWSKITYSRYVMEDNGHWGVRDRYLTASKADFEKCFEPASL